MTAHELRNIASTISNAVEIIRLTRGDNPVTAKAIQVIKRQLEELLRLADELAGKPLPPN